MSWGSGAIPFGCIPERETPEELHENVVDELYDELFSLESKLKEMFLKKHSTIFNEIKVLEDIDGPAKVKIIKEKLDEFKNNGEYKDEEERAAKMKLEIDNILSKLIEECKTCPRMPTERSAYNEWVKVIPEVVDNIGEFRIKVEFKRFVGE